MALLARFKRAYDTGGIGEICRSMGMDEIITYSFISPAY